MIGEPQQTHVPRPNPPRKRRLWPLALVALVVLGGGTWFYTHHKPAGEAGEKGAGKGKGQNLPPVLAAPVEVGAVPLELNAVGAVEAYSSVAVRAQTAGPLLRVAFQQDGTAEIGAPGVFNIPTGQNPTGLIATRDAEYPTAFVGNLISRDVSVLALAEQRKVTDLRSTEQPQPGSREFDIWRGKRFFNTATGIWARDTESAA